MPATPAPALVIGALVIGLERNLAMPHGTAFLIGQIKLTRIHVLELFLPGVRVKRTVKASLYDVERSGSASP